MNAAAVVPQGECPLSYRWAGLQCGPVIAFSHSLGTDDTMWDPQIEVLGNAYRLLLYDHPGHGRSGPRQRGSGAVPISTFGQEFVALMDQLGLTRVHFCGLSLGGMVGQWLGANAPQRLDRLILCNTAARIENTSLLRSRIAEIRRDGLEGMTEGILEKWLTATFRHSNPQTCAHARAMLARTTSSVYADTAETVCQLDLRAALPRIHVPTLVIGGEFDEATPLAWNRAVADNIASARLTTLPTAHLSNLEAPRAFNRALLEFLKP